MTASPFAATGIGHRSIQLAQATTVPWGQVGVNSDTARGWGLANPRGTQPNAPAEVVPWYAKLVRWASVGLQIAEVLKAIAGPAPIYRSEIAIGDAGDLAVRIYGKSYHGPEAGSAVFIRGIGGASLGVPAAVTEQGLRFDVGALEKAYGKALPAVLKAAIAGAAIPSVGSTVLESRNSTADARLSTTASYARALVASQARFAKWEAHHLIPFASIERLPMATKLAIARSGWKMDSEENLVVLPGDEESYGGPPNYRVRPFHRGPHPNYNREVENRLGHLAWAAPTMDLADIRAELKEIEASMFGRLLDRARGYHPRVSFVTPSRPSAFG